MSAKRCNAEQICTEHDAAKSLKLNTLLQSQRKHITQTHHIIQHNNKCYLVADCNEVRVTSIDRLRMLLGGDVWVIDKFVFVILLDCKV